MSVTNRNRPIRYRQLWILMLLVGIALSGPVCPAESDAATPSDPPTAQEKSLPPQALESLKSTSAAVLTNTEFEAWWKRYIITKAPNEAGFHPVSTQAPEHPPLQGTIQWQEYRLKPSDVISIQILGHPELSRTNLMISPDGTIQLPLVGRIQVKGLTPDTLMADLSNKMSQHLKHASLNVSLDKIAPQRIYVLGAVKNPGMYMLDGQEVRVGAIPSPNFSPMASHLSTALMKAGGILADADLSHVKVLNQAEATHSESNILELLAYGALSYDYLLDADSVVYVPRLPANQWNHPEILKLLADSNIGQDTYPVRVYGLVSRPDVYQLAPGEMTLQTVLAKAGIDIDKAQRKKLIIARTMSNQQLLTIPVDATRKDTVLYPNDVVIVANATWRHRMRDIFTAVASFTQPAANLKYIMDTGNSVTP